jgi:hypothetical protein
MLPVYEAACPIALPCCMHVMCRPSVQGGGEHVAQPLGYASIPSMKGAPASCFVTFSFPLTDGGMVLVCISPVRVLDVFPLLFLVLLVDLYRCTSVPIYIHFCSINRTQMERTSSAVAA